MRQNSDVKLIRSETVVNKIVDLDADWYDFEVSTGLANQQVSVMVDFEEGKFDGSTFAYGQWLNLTTEECIKYLDMLEKDEIVRDFDEIKKIYAHEDIRENNEKLKGRGRCIELE